MIQDDEVAQRFAKLPPEVQVEATLAAREMILSQAAARGYDEFAKTVHEMGGSVDIVVHFHDQQDCHIAPPPMQIAA